MFQFELVVTEKCNLSCKYCYMKNRELMMSKETFDRHYAILPKMMKKYNETRFTTTLFGGEPLLNWDLIPYILSKVYKKSHGIVLPTNGLLLTPAKIETLKVFDVNISLSFDGLWQNGFDPEKDLNKYRNIVNSIGVKTCKAMVSPQSMREIGLVRNYKWFVEDFDLITSPDFTLVRDDIWSELDVAVYRYEIEKLADQVIEYIKKGVNTLPGIFSLYILDTIIGEKYGKRPFGCFAGVSGLGFMPDGYIYPCARFGSEGECMLYNAYEPDQEIAKIDFKKVTDPRTFKKCQACELYRYCNAGCTYSQNFGEPLDCICDIYKATYKQAFRIVDELKDNNLFKKIINNLIRRIENDRM